MFVDDDYDDISISRVDEFWQRYSKRGVQTHNAGVQKKVPQSTWEPGYVYNQKEKDQK